MRVLDPCCGSGTIVIEAALQGALAFGGDSDLAAVQAAQVNCQAAGIAVSIQHWQAQALPLAAASVDRVISNLPWGVRCGWMRRWRASMVRRWRRCAVFWPLVAASRC